ncbi:hypothetical protein EDF67_102530 [Sphingobacterium sp. JUb78]|nr:hypothetical protein [Sphingobacterium kitahiroshimense]TCR13116.1 hypothetical protein EDF67_102530 [Sphingobacterium sp. JUb78]
MISINLHDAENSSYIYCKNKTKQGQKTSINIKAGQILFEIIKH